MSSQPQGREHTFNPSSPRSSSGGAESFGGTPDTRLTAFSPDDGSTKSVRLLKDLARSASTTPPVRLPVNSSRGAISQLDKDPFITPTHGPATKLSPMASTFNPFTNPGYVSLQEGRESVSAVLSTHLGLSRHLDISSASKSVPASAVEAWLIDLEAKGMRMYGARSLNAVAGLVHVCFDDIRDSSSVHAHLNQLPMDWNGEYVGTAQCEHSSKKTEASPIGKAVCPNGQLFIIAVPTPGRGRSAIEALDAVQAFFQSYGQLFAFVCHATFADGSFRAVVEFCNVAVAVPFVKVPQNNLMIEGIHLVLAPYNQPEWKGAAVITGALQAMSFGVQRGQPMQRPAGFRSMEAGAGMHAGGRDNQPVGLYPYMLQPPFPTNMPYMLDHLHPMSQNAHTQPLTPNYPPIMGSLYQTPPSPALTVQRNYSPSRPGDLGKADARRQNAARVSRSSYHNAANHHNHVDVSRIREGIDVRTTIMLRNIPNKVDQAMLKRIVDESSWGKYDFMYLRIDFANDCNVGYAFINFVDPLDIIDFVEARGNQRWNCFKSDKVAEISYATIQGKDCLVQKFRNSSVMLEAPHYRPKLYFTSNGPMPDLAGQEEPFPDPDNQSKMKRSCENAEHVGLFTPNAGQHFRDEQRRRRSQYDRGTRLAALEEYDYETAIHQQLYSPTSQ